MNTLEVVFPAFLETIWVNEAVRARVVGRIDVDQSDFAEIRLLQNLENFKIFALDEDMLRIVEVHRKISLRAECGGRRELQDLIGVIFASPCQHIPFAALNNLGSDSPFESGDVQTAFGKCLRKEVDELFPFYCR